MLTDVEARSSSLSQFPDCERRWAARNLRGELAMYGWSVRILPNSVGAVIGSGTHAAVAYDLTHKMETGELAGQADCLEVGVEELRNRIAEEGVIYDDVSPDVNNAESQVRRLHHVYRNQVGARVKPVAVERRLRGRHKSGIVSSGQQDLVVVDPVTLKDLKTGKVRGANHAQYGNYSQLLRSHGTPVAQIFEDFTRRAPLSKPQPPVVEVRYDLEACETMADAVLNRIAERIERFRRTGGDRDVWLANPNSMLCRDTTCPAHGTPFCQYGRSR